jgi:hypothetical protein
MQAAHIEMYSDKYKQLMQVNYTTDLNLLEKRISRLNEMPEKFKHLLNGNCRNKTSNGVNSILKVPDEYALFMKNHL